MLEIGSLMDRQSQVTYDVPAADVQDSELDTITLAFTTNAARGRLLRVESSSSGSYEELALTNPLGMYLEYNLLKYVLLLDFLCNCLLMAHWPDLNPIIWIVAM